MGVQKTISESRQAGSILESTIRGT